MNKLLLIILLSLNAYGLSGCGENSESSQKDQVLANKQKWEELKLSKNGNYQIFYKHTGFYPDTTTVFFVDVINSEISSSPDVTGFITMDGLYERALSVIEDKNCTLILKYEPESPVIKSYFQACGSESSGFEITEFD